MSISIKAIFNNLFSSNLAISPDDIELKKVNIINLVVIIGIPLNTIFVFANYASGQILFAYFNLLVIFIMFLTFFYLRRSYTHIRSASHAVILGMFIIHMVTLFQGGIINSGFVWFFLFPLVAIFLTGRNAGSIWISALFGGVIIVFIFAPYLDLPYDPRYLLYLLTSLMIETIYLLFVQNIQLRYEAELSNKNEELQHLTRYLQKEVNKELLKSRAKDAMLTQQSKMASIGEMMGHISHQWKQPLGTINILMQNLQLAQVLGDEDPEMLNKSLKEVINQTDLMQETMKDFLLFLRPNLKDKTFSVQHALHIMETLLSSSFANKNILLTINQPVAELKLIGKENDFVHAIMNITNNAKDILIERHIKDAHITIDLFEKDNTINLKIKDNAGGIAEDIIDKIFDPYFSTRLDQGGTGLGLYMTRTIIQEHMNGTIEVKNEPQGASFCLTFKI